MYTVNLYGSNPSLENDDCWTGEQFETKGEALAAYLNARETFESHTLNEGEWIEVDGPDIHLERPLSKGEWHCSRKQNRLDDSLWASESMWEHRMLHGTAD